jgi:hypothetical protein
MAACLAGAAAMLAACWGVTLWLPEDRKKESKAFFF